MSSNNQLLAYYKATSSASESPEILNVLNSAPKLKDGNWVYEDTINGNDLKIESGWFRTIESMYTGSTNRMRVIKDFGSITEYSTIISVYCLSEVVDDGFFRTLGSVYVLGSGGNTITFFGGNVQTVNITYDYLNKPLRIGMSIKSDGDQCLYINGVCVSRISGRPTFTITGSQTVQPGHRIYSLNGYMWNFQLFNRQLSDADFAFDYANQHLTVFDSPTFSQTYTNRKDIGLIWFKMTTGWGSKTILTGSLNKEWDCSGNANHSEQIKVNTTDYCWQNTNPYWHANLSHGFTLFTAFNGDPVYCGFDWNYKASVNYNAYVNQIYQKHMPVLGGFAECESTVTPTTLTLPDYNNFWYDVSGTPNKKTFADFNFTTLNNQIYVDGSMAFFKTLLFETQISKFSQLKRNKANDGKLASNNIVMISDSMFSNTYKQYNSLMAKQAKQLTYAKCLSYGGAKSYELADDFLTNPSIVGSSLPSDIKTRYPDNPNGLWTGFDTVVNGLATKDYLDKFQYERTFYQVLWMGGNQALNTYAGTPDYGTIHYRLIPDLDRLINYNTGMPKRGCIMMTNFPAAQFNECWALYQAKAVEYGYDTLNPFPFFNEVYEYLKNDDASHPVIQKLLELDFDGQHIRIIDNKIYLYTDYKPKVNSLGQPLNANGEVVSSGQIQSTSAGWVRLGETVPNTIVNIDGVDYYTYNACLNPASVTTNPFTADNPGDPYTFVTSFKRDAVHPNYIGETILAVKLFMMSGNYNV